MLIVTRVIAEVLIKRSLLPGALPQTPLFRTVMIECRDGMGKVVGTAFKIVDGARASAA